MKKKIVPLGMDLDYLSARRILAAKGLKLPSNVLHDEFLSESENPKEQLYPAWAREIVAFPERDGSFKLGADVVDSTTGWILPARYIPKDAFGRRGIGLFLEPTEFIEEKGRVVVYPIQPIRVLSSFIQQNGDYGMIDEETGIPLGTKPNAEIEIRWLIRGDGNGIRPIIRYQGDYEENHSVILGGVPDMVLGVSAEVSDISGFISLVNPPILAMLFDELQNDPKALARFLSAERIAAIGKLMDSMELLDLSD